MDFHPTRRPLHPLRRQEEGYILLTLLLMVSLMTIAAFAVLPTIAFEIRRDREEEMIHRGVQYSRAIRSYYKKFSRYPTRLEDLDNTNNLRYLRKRYKDPVNKNRDFKLLHYGDPGLSIGGSIGGGTLAGATSVSALSSSGSNGSTFGGSSSAFGGSASSSAFGGNSSGGSNSAFGSGFSNSANSGTSNGAGTSNTPGANSTSGSDSTDASAQIAPGTATTGATSSNQQVIGGAPIVGVVSLSKDTTIREFNHKRKYNEWQFVYDPIMDQGGLLMTPNQPALQLGGASQIGQPAGANPSGSSFGQSSFGQSSFGQSSGFGNNNSGSTGGSPTPPSNPPQQ